MRPRAEDPLTVTEERLRAAFAARAALVTYRDLRRDEPPEGRSWGLRRVRGIAFASLGAVAAAAAVAAAYLLFLVPAGTVSPTPAPPARPPGVGESPVTPTPSPVAPSVTGPGAAPEPGAVQPPGSGPKPGAAPKPGASPEQGAVSTPGAGPTAARTNPKPAGRP
ncbi:hypothetical protein ACFY8C_26490 [Streptomyces flavochromogenes]|uniref:Uncharacterized protein n=1 Tax=Streptomyces flavochromogenes TaxID=68199 RepID=A0ABW6XWI0_9ACTN|nr:hypothetical protein [Streptomyces flavochromogenes]